MRIATVRAVAGGAAFAAASTGLAAADPFGVADLAPKNAIFVAGTSDFSAAEDAFKRTGLAALLEEPEMRAWIDRTFDERPDWFDETLEDLGLELKDVEKPAGRAGVAIWRGAEPDTGAPRLEYLLAADFAGGADQVEDVALAMIERGEDDEALEVWTEEYNVSVIYVFERIPPEPDDPDPGGFDDFEEFDGLDHARDEPPQRFHFTRFEDWLLLTSDMASMHRILDRLDGADLHVAADRPEYPFALEMASPRHFGAVLFVRPLIDAILAFRDDDAAGVPDDDVRAVLDALGVGAIDSLSAGGAFDAPSGMLEVRHGAATRGKPGLLGLMDVEPMIFEPPLFIPDSVVDLTASRFAFDRLLPVINQALADLPAALRQQAAPTVGMLSATAGPLLQAIGPDTYVARRITRPFNADSNRALTAIEVRDEAVVAQSIAQLGGFLGVEERDFEGVRVWDIGQGEYAVALHAGYALIGRAVVVEDAIRRADDRGAAEIEDDPSFQRALDGLHDEAAFFSFSRLRPALEYLHWTQQNWERLFREDLQQWEADEDQIDTWIEQEREFREDNPLTDFPPPDVLSRHLGDTAADLRPTLDGFQGRIIWLRPE